jgi:hypothetical protein
MSTALQINSVAAVPVIQHGTGERCCPVTRCEWGIACYPPPMKRRALTLAEQQKAEYLGRLTAAPLKAAYAVTEPDTGSDVAGVKTRAHWDPVAKEWVLNGAKMWITHGEGCARPRAKPRGPPFVRVGDVCSRAHSPPPPPPPHHAVGRQGASPTGILCWRPRLPRRCPPASGSRVSGVPTCPSGFAGRGAPVLAPPCPACVRHPSPPPPPLLPAPLPPCEQPSSWSPRGGGCSRGARSACWGSGAATRGV